MNSLGYLDGMKNIQVNILEFLENETNSEENYQNLISIFDGMEICNKPLQLKSVLYLLTKIANNHHHGLNFYDKIFRIINIFKEYIKNYYFNWEIFDIFKKNKRLILFLIEEQIMFFDEQIIESIIKNGSINTYCPYFTPEFKKFLDEDWFQDHEWLAKEISKEIPNNFNEKRKNGENDDIICNLIQKDMIKEFIVYMNKNNISINETIWLSDYETNSFLIKIKKCVLIEYAAFFGSIQIFKYLNIQGIELTSSLWLFAIHGNNSEIILMLDENNAKPEKKSYEQCFIESIKCHHNDMANFILINYMQNEYEKSENVFNQAIKYYNFAFIKKRFINESSFINLCKYDYYDLVHFIMKNNNVKLNKADIMAHKILIQFHQAKIFNDIVYFCI